MCFVNKLDRTGASFERCVSMIKDRLGATAAVLQLPIGIEETFIGVIDLVKMKAVIWRGDDLGASYDYTDIPTDLQDNAILARAELIDIVAALDDDVLESYLNGDELTEAQIKHCIRKGTIEGSITPVLCGSAFKNKGVQTLLDAVIYYLPSPINIPPAKGFAVTRSGEITNEVDVIASDDGKMLGLAFKVMNDPFVGSLTFIRLYSGILKAGTSVVNTVKGEKERIGRILLMHANNREDITEAFAGDIIAVAGLKKTTTGDTLCEEGGGVILEKMDFPEPVIEVAVEPKTIADQDKMSAAISRLIAEDPSLRVKSDPETNQTVLAGMGELHLEIIIDRMKREFKVEANIGEPQVAYRETITKSYEIDYTHKKQSGGAGQYARVKILFEPCEGYTFESKIVGGSVPKEYIPAVDKGIKDASKSGVLAGYPLINFKATLLDGAYHDVDSSALAFEIAAKASFREGAAKAGAKILEPMMKVEVITPEDFMGDVIGHLNSIRGQILGMTQRANAQVISANVPLASMFGYVSTLRSMTQGRAQYSMHFSHYEQVPQNIADSIIEKSK